MAVRRRLASNPPLQHQLFRCYLYSISDSLSRFSPVIANPSWWTQKEAAVISAPKVFATLGPVLEVTVDNVEEAKRRLVENGCEVVKDERSFRDAILKILLA